MKIRIYQINMGKDEKRVAYQGLDELERFQGSKEIDSGIYECVFDGEVDSKGLEDVFRKFNYERPDGYTGHSLSVSLLPCVPSLRMQWISSVRFFTGCLLKAARVTS